MPNLVEKDASSWSKFVTDFDKTFANWQNTYQSLSAKKAFIAAHPEYASRYTAIMSTGASDLVKLQDLKQTRDAAAAWLKSISSGLMYPIRAASEAAQSVAQTGANAWDWLVKRSPLSLGAIPLVAIAITVSVALATIAAIYANWSQASKFDKELQARIELINKGYSPAQAEAAVKSSSSVNIPFLNINQDTLRLVMIAGVILFVAPMLLKSMGGKRHG